MPQYVFLILDISILVIMFAVLWSQWRSYKAAKEVAELERRNAEAGEELVAVLRELNATRVRFEKDGEEVVIDFGGDSLH